MPQAASATLGVGVEEAPLLEVLAEMQLVRTSPAPPTAPPPTSSPVPPLDEGLAAPAACAVSIGDACVAPWHLILALLVLNAALCIGVTYALRRSLAATARLERRLDGSGASNASSCSRTPQTPQAAFGRLDMSRAERHLNDLRGRTPRFEGHTEQERRLPCLVENAAIAEPGGAEPGAGGSGDNGGDDCRGGCGGGGVDGERGDRRDRVAPLMTAVVVESWRGRTAKQQRRQGAPAVEDGSSAARRGDGLRRFPLWRRSPIGRPALRPAHRTSRRSAWPATHLESQRGRGEKPGSGCGDGPGEMVGRSEDSAAAATPVLLPPAALAPIGEGGSDEKPGSGPGDDGPGEMVGRRQGTATVTPVALPLAALTPLVLTPGGKLREERGLSSGALSHRTPRAELNNERRQNLKEAPLRQERRRVHARLPVGLSQGSVPHTMVVATCPPRGGGSEACAESEAFAAQLPDATLAIDGPDDGPAAPEAGVGSAPTLDLISSGDDSASWSACRPGADASTPPLGNSADARPPRQWPQAAPSYNQQEVMHVAFRI